MLGVVVAASVAAILTLFVLFRLGIKYTLTLGFILGVITASLYASALRDWESEVFFQTRALHDEKFASPSSLLFLALFFWFVHKETDSDSSTKERPSRSRRAT